MAGRPSSAYAEDLAYVHHVGFDQFVRAAAPWIVWRLRAAGWSDGLVVELGCGGGLAAAAFGRAGYDVLGVDLSQPLLRHARREAPNARFIKASAFRVRLPRCVAVVAIGEVLNYAFDPRSGRAALSRLLNRIYLALEPGGLLIFDIAQPEHVRGAGEMGFTLGADWAVLYAPTEDRAKRKLTRRIVTFRKHGKDYVRSEETHVQHLYDASELLGELRSMGFVGRLYGGYGRFRMTRGRRVIAVRKPC